MGVGRDRSTIFGKKAALATIRKGIRTPRLGRWSTMQNLIGDAGDNRLELSLKSTRVNCGRSRFRPMPSSMLAMMVKPRTLTGREPAWFLPTPWAVKTETCRTFGCGLTTLRPLPRNTECPHQMNQPSWKRCLRAHLASTRTPCLGNWRTSFQGELPTFSTCRGQTTPWTQRVPRQWLRFWMHAGCFRHVRST